MILDKAPSDWKGKIEKLSEPLHGRSRWRLPVLFFGILFSQLLPGKRPVTSWLKASGVTKGFQQYYYFLGSLGRLYIDKLADVIWDMVLGIALWNHSDVTIAIDDSPTRRYGPKVEGAGRHHDHTGKPTNQTILYGHVWVTLSVVVRHFWYGLIGLPLKSKLYVCEKDVCKLPKKYKWNFQTKLDLAGDLLSWFHEKCEGIGKKLTVVFDGGYSKANFLKHIPKGVTAVGKLRKDAALKTLPEPRKPGQKGRNRKYGKNKISLAKRAGQKRGWQTAEVHGKIKEFKAFKATYRSAPGPILVVLLRFSDGNWAPYFCTDLNLDPIRVLELVDDRWAIEENFNEVKEVLGAGQQQVRNLWANIACWHLNLWTCALVYLWSWRKPHEFLVDRSNAPWDVSTRRPSLADRLRALRRCFWESAISDAKLERTNKQKFQEQLRRLLAMIA